MKRVSDVDYIALLNPDSWVEKDWLEQMVSVMEKNPQAGCCGAAEHPYDETLPVAKEQLTSTKAGCWMGGGSFILRKKALDSAEKKFETTGLFDELYFMYTEDMDITWRLQLVGYTIIKNNNAIWHHHGRKRSNEATGWRVYYCSLNRIFILLKFGSSKQIRASLWRYIQYFILGKRKKEREQNMKEDIKKEDIGNNGKAYITKWITRARKLFFVIKLCIAIFYHLPQALQRRLQMKKHGIDYKRTDAWIQETDMQLYGV